MSFNFSGVGTVNVSGTISTTAPTTQPTPTLSTAQSIITISVTCDNSTKDSYTVPTGYKFMPYTIHCNWMGGDDVVNYYMYENDASTVRALLCRNKITSVGFNPSMTLTSAIPLHVYTAGQIVKAKGTAGNMYITGILEAV